MNTSNKEIERIAFDCLKRQTVKGKAKERPFSITDLGIEMIA